MRNAALPFLAAVLLALSPIVARAQQGQATDTKAFSDSQKAAIEEIIKNYLTKDHPEVVGNAMIEIQSRPDLVRGLQERQQQLASTKNEQALSSQHDKIYNNPDTPVGGNPKGDVTVVEFFDYQCPFCKSSHKNIQQLLKEDKNIKFIYEEYPVLGPTSVSASKAAIASIKQGKYFAYHDALMVAPFSHNQRPADDDALIYKTAKDVGLNVEKLKKDMADADNDKTIKDNHDLGEAVGATGTPMFIIGDKVFPGAMEYDAMKKAVDDARAANKPPAP